MPDVQKEWDLKIFLALIQTHYFCSLFSHGIFDKATVANFSQMLQRVNEIGGVLSVPHPLQQCPLVGVDQFHLELLKYCIEHGLQHLLWSYCTTHR